MRFRKLRPYEKPLDAFILAVVLLVLAGAGYELGGGFAGLAGGLVAVTSGAIQHYRRSRRSSPD
jgi:hypothetical protein